MADRILRGTVAGREVTFYGDEAPVDATGPVAVTVTNASGVVVFTGNATLQGDGTGRYRYTLPAQTTVAHLTEVWSGTFAGQAQNITTQAEIVGGFYVPVAQLRTLPNLSSATQFPTAKLVAARYWFESKFEDYTGVAWVPRYGRDDNVIHINPTLFDHYPVRRVLSVSVRNYDDTFTAYTTAELAAVNARLPSESGLVRLPTARLWAPYGMVTEYEHGYKSPPADVVHAAGVAIRAKLMEDQSGGPPNRQFGFASEGAFVPISTAGEGRPFGIHEVDQVANARRHKTPAIA